MAQHPLTIPFDPFAKAVRLDPYPHYVPLRGVPVFRTVLCGRDVYGVAGYHNVMAGLSDHTRFSAKDGLGLQPRDRFMSGVLVAADPPEHGRIKRAIGPLMTPTVLRSWEPTVEQWADDLVERLLGTGTIDVIEDLGRPFMVNLVAEFVGLPARSRDLFPGWADACTNLQGPFTVAVKRAHMDRLTDMPEYIGWLKEQGPDQVTPGRLASGVFAAAAAGQISLDEAVNLIWGAMIIAGLHSSISFVGHLFRAMTLYPDVWTEVAADPRLAGPLIDELIRWDTALTQFWRTAVEGAEVGGIEIPAGSRVMFLYGSANRDPDRWTHPDTVDIHRPDVDEHASFGSGRHLCLGAPLLKLGVSALIRALARHDVVGFRITDTLELHDNTMVRGWRSVPVDLLTRSRLTDLRAG